MANLRVPLTPNAALPYTVAALTLFLIGIIGYLKAIGISTMAPSACLLGILLLFLGGTAVTPIFMQYCPYRSPQALWACMLWYRFLWIVYHSLSISWTWICWVGYSSSSETPPHGIWVGLRDCFPCYKLLTSCS